MADIEITTNSPKAIADLQSVQKASKITSSVIATDNAKNKKSFETLSGSIGTANNVYNNMGNTVSSVSAVIGEFGPVLETSVAQINVVTAALTLMNGQLIQSIADMTALTAATDINTASMAEDLAQNVLSTETAATLDAMILQAKGTMDAYNESVLTNSQYLDTNKESTEELSGMVTATNELLGIYNETLQANSLENDLNKTAVEANKTIVESQKETIDRLMASVGACSENLLTLSGNVANYSRMLSENTTETDKNTGKAEENNGVKAALAVIEGVLGALTAFNTGVSTADNIVKAQELLLSKKKQNENKKETATETAKGIAKLGALMTSPVGIAIGIAAVAALAATVAILKSVVSYPAMATGGVVSAPTVALVGEGRYPEAVVPLGDSPQFASMKADIANAVLQGIAALKGANKRTSSGSCGEIVLNVDGTKLARAVLPRLESEQKRRGYDLTLREV